MKILIYGINYAPELTGIGKYTAEMAATLAVRAHDVRVVCAPPYYPQWRVGADYSKWRYISERLDGVQITRAPLWVPSKPKGIKRIVHLASFALSSAPVMLRQLFWRPDIVITIAPSLLNAPLGALVARLTSAHAWLHIQDYEVDAAFGLGMLKGSRLRRFALSAERWMLGQFDTVSTISNRMLDRAADKGVPRHRLVSFPNWADTDMIFPIEATVQLRSTLMIASDATVVLYSGNMGTKQGLEVLVSAAKALDERPDIVFVFCGNGPTRSAMQEACCGLANCRFIDLRPPEQLNELLNLADIHVLPQRADAADLVMPSKLTGMFASGRAVIAMANPGTELHDVVKPRGVVVAPGDTPALTAAIVALTRDPAAREQLGRAGRHFAVTHLSRESVLLKLDEYLRVRYANRHAHVSGAAAKTESAGINDVYPDA